jgi:predicted ATP-dependent endonuclease of OLD family
MNTITRFEIKKLHGYKTVDLRFVDNTLILVGENGAGKTTVLNLFYYLLSGQWSSMVKYEFEEVSIAIGNKNYKLRHSELEKSFQKIDRRFLSALPPSIARRIMILMESREGRLVTPELEALCREYGLPIEYLLRELDLGYQDPGKKTEPLRRTLEAIAASLDAQLLFLPTYRRIEQELNLIFKGLDERELKNRRDLLTSRRDNKTFVELIEFGMKDVDDAIKSTLFKLNTFARESLNKLTFGYLGDVVEEQYTTVDLNAIKNASVQTIDNILNRIQEPVLSSANKQHLREIIDSVKTSTEQTDHKKIICHYFSKLMGFQKELETKEAHIMSFCAVCNEYMADKVFRYDISNFSFTIRPKGDEYSSREIMLNHLSSGEKQIVSLFSHLYLSGGNRYFVLIDEPELSLSVPWQRRFLADIRKAQFCTGLVAVTHSPFIYDNELSRYAHGLGEFVA